jgi:hypothetical protein
MLHFISLINGLALAVGFIGLFGFAIDASQWLVSVVLLLVSVGLVGLASSLKGYYRYANIPTKSNR